MPKTFEADSVELHKLFEGKDSFYRIPDYQRPYSWEKDQVEQLWDDLFDAWQRLNEEEPEPYFLGSVILIDENEEEDRMDILDGQQRITTLLIFYTVIRDCFPEVVEHRPDIDRRIVRSVRGEQRYRLQTGSNGKASFIDTVLDQIDFEKDNTYVTAAQLTRDAIDEEFDEIGELVNFVDFVEDTVELVRIKSSSLSHAIRMFQTVNTRGKDLTVSDLTKSYLLYKAENPDEREAVVDGWQEITTKFNDNYGSIDRFLGSYRFYLKADKGKQSVYEELRDEFDTMLKEEYSVVNIINDIATYARAYLEVKKETSYKRYTLSNLTHGLYWPSVLAGAKKDGFNDIEALKDELIAFYYAYWIAGHTAEKIKIPSTKIMSLVKEEGTIRAVKGETRKKREKDNIADKVKNNLYSNVYGESWHRRLLVAIEYQLSKDAKITYIDVGNNLHCEHILPKSHKTAIKKSEYWSDRFDENSASLYKNSFGNLVPLESELNGSAQIKGFDDKREIYIDEFETEDTGLTEPTSFALTKHVVDNFDEWDANAIRSFRATLIAETAKLLNYSPEELLDEEEDFRSPVPRAT